MEGLKESYYSQANRPVQKLGNEFADGEAEERVQALYEDVIQKVGKKLTQAQVLREPSAVWAALGHDLAMRSHQLRDQPFRTIYTALDLLRRAIRSLRASKSSPSEEESTFSPSTGNCTPPFHSANSNANSLF